MFSMFALIGAPSCRDQGTAFFVSEVARRPRWSSRNRDHFWRTIDAVTADDAMAIGLTRRIERKQRQLQRSIGEPAWRAYLEIEELQARRTLRWIELVATWAKGHGPVGRRSKPR